VTNHAHFTVLGFTATTSEPPLCTITFAGKTLKKMGNWIWSLCTMGRK